jgi:hypothetical protein
MSYSPEDSVDDSLEATLNKTLDKGMAWLDKPAWEATTLDEALAWLAVVNDRLAVRDDALSADVIEKLQKWLARLLAKLRELARGLNAPTFSITVGTTVSVTVTFAFNESD